MLTGLVNKAYAASIDSSSLQRLKITPLMGDSTSLLDAVARILTWIFLIGGIVAVVYLIYGGLLYITAGGDAEKATKGRVAIVNAIIGIVIIALAFLIVIFVNNTLQNRAA